MYCHSLVCLKTPEHSETPQNARKSLLSIGLILLDLQRNIYVAAGVA